jgi:hypothetical protein
VSVLHTVQAEKVWCPRVADQHPPLLRAHLPGPIAEVYTGTAAQPDEGRTRTPQRHGGKKACRSEEKKTARRPYLCSQCSRRPRSGRRSPRGTRTPGPGTCPGRPSRWWPRRASTRRSCAGTRSSRCLVRETRFRFPISMQGR